MPEVADALPRGYSLHEYRIDSLLGAGGFGLTYLAVDSNLNLKVALKEFLPGDIAARGSDNTVQPRSETAIDSFRWGLKRFMEEARTLASFQHPGIVRVMRFFEANRTGYMVMELLEGNPLSSWIESRRPLPQAALLGLAGPLLDGLEVIHKSGYLHRDIKPANVFIRGDGSPVLLDFGSARQLTGEKNQELTAVVSPGYAPFEQYHTHGKQGPWTDLYALGGVLYWIVSAQKPVEAAARVRKDVLAPAAQVAIGPYNNQLLAAIDWALKPNEEERPQSVAEFRRALAAAAGRPGGGDRTVPVGPGGEATVVNIPSGAAPATATGMTGLTGVALDRAEMKRMETELAQHIGPIAATVLRGAAKKADTIAALAEAVAPEIAGEKERAAFLRKFAPGQPATGAPRTQTRSAPDLSTSQKFSADCLKQAETALAQYIGAVARVVVNRAAVKARDEAELYLLLSDEIKDPVERKNFVRKAVSASRR